MSRIDLVSKNLLAKVDLHLNFTLGRVNTLVSRKAMVGMVGLPPMGVARSNVNWMYGLTALRWRWKLSNSVDLIHAFKSLTRLNHQRGETVNVDKA